MKKATTEPRPAVTIKFPDDDKGRDMKRSIDERADHHGIPTVTYLKLLALAEIGGETFGKRLERFRASKV